MMTVMHGVIVD